MADKKFDSDELISEATLSIDRAIRKAGLAGLDSAKQTAPVRTGALRNSLSLYRIGAAHYHLTGGVSYAKYQWPRFRQSTLDAIGRALDDAAKE